MMIHLLEGSAWEGSFSDEQKAAALHALENGEVIYLPTLSFELSAKEKSSLITPSCLQSKSKNISFNPKNNQLKGTHLQGFLRTQLRDMMVRFVVSSEALLNALIPQYQGNLIKGRTSYRPVEIQGRKSSIRKDDTRLHVDAFAATPNQGKRILRIFSNVNPYGQSRHWHLGEPFETVVEKFSPLFQKPIVGSRKLLSLLNITKSYRSLYDHYMLLLHDCMKLDDDYQQAVQKQVVHFPPGSSWIVMTDAVSHAALAGQYLLEQTFYLPVKSMHNPELSPLRVLERHLGKSKFTLQNH